MRKALAAPIAAGVLGLAALAIPVAAQADTGPTGTTFGVNAARSASARRPPPAWAR